MNTITLKKRLIEKINNLSEEQLNSVISFVEQLEYLSEEDQKIKRPQTDEERMALVEKFKQLCAETQAIFADNPITEEEIQAEIDAYRRGE
ncbi:MAG: hypothetical protein EWV52_17595 [Microcystis panniformis Mp_MB_F_20051200_S6D]|nr:MAG: hypothetical protein EWV43_02185 [Microcystis panniformis Mp_MB_F_20080800_S26D]TRV53860.1 MAG: hypothetical protein EWV42_05175 [Microcystis panniformis Mp_GB_SS_20050300_S99D]TRV61803.1 MAG: hypothetical protein EWV86_14490 [Microcystis panniformis Mp_MB_F_20051200_S9D]TRV69984.1 MAG: hypothetical protein EWV52_17595 [Microcystis panniformis Mp_MB_F_20051200_S6D]